MDQSLKLGGLGGRTCAFICAVVVACVLGAATARAQSEEGVKAAFLYNFAKFTEWPAASFSDASAHIVVAFIGSDSLADTFEKNVSGKNVNGREFTVKKLSSAAGAEMCHIVFVAKRELPAELKSKPVLTIGDGDAFASGGGCISFVMDGPKVAFVLNLKAVKGASLKTDPKLEKVAKSVQ